MDIKSNFDTKKVEHTVVNRWKYGKFEMLLVKIPPSGNKSTLFAVIGKGSEGTIYKVGTKLTDSYLNTYDKYEVLVKNLKKKLKI